MQRTIAAEIDAPAHEVFSVLDDLATYPAWLDIVSKVTPADPEPGEPGPAWWVTLRAQVGPFARSKRLRMVRAHSDAPRTLRYDRAEVDGRSHSAWSLEAAIEGSEPSAVRVDLRYEGALWSAPLEAILKGQATDAVPRLQALIAER